MAQLTEDLIIEPITKAEKGTLHKSIHSGKWLSLGYVWQKGVGVVSFFILARLLTPADFGVAALMLLIPKLLQSSTEPGFGAAAIQKSGDIRHYLNPIWTLGIIKAALIASAVALTAPFLAHMLHAEQATEAIRLGGLCILIQNLSNIGEIFLFKDLLFKRIFIRNVLRDISYSLVAIIGAWWFRSYWILIIATFVSNIVQTISTYFLHPFRPRLTFNFRPLKNLFHYSKWVVGQGWLDQFNGFMEQSVVTRFGGVSGIGLYSKAKSMASVPTGFLNPVITTVSFPAYARIKNAPEKVRDGFIKSLDVIFFFLIPITTLILYAGGILVTLVLGKIWLPMTNPLRLLLLFYLFNSINDLSNTLVNALGHPEKEVHYNLIKTVVTLTLLIPLTMRAGISGAALALLLGTLPTLAFNISAIVRFTGLHLGAIVSTALVPLLSSAVIVIPLMLAKETFLIMPVWGLVLTTGIAGLLYGGQVILWGALFKRGPYKTLHLIIQHSL